MHRSLLAFSLGFFLLIAMALSIAAAPQQCGPRPAVIATLSDRYGEAPRMRGLANGVIVELLANDDSGSWTILVTRPDGSSCLLVAGTAYAPIPVTPPSDPA